MKRLVIGMSGASGSIYAIRMLEMLKSMEEVETHPKPELLTFNRAWPKAVKEKVLANWERWRFRTPDPVLQRHATQNTPWVYFNKTGEGETGRGHNL